jgi:hypothetical protein
MSAWLLTVRQWGDGREGLSAIFYPIYFNTSFQVVFHKTMKNKDIEKAVKYNGLYIMNDRALLQKFSSLHPIKKQNIPKGAA